MRNSEFEPQIEKERPRGPWPVEIGENQEIIGLPKGIDRKDIITCIGTAAQTPAGKKHQWFAVNPSKEILKERDLWLGQLINSLPEDLSEEEKPQEIILTLNRSELPENSSEEFKKAA